tara:strand:+ start:156 stop:1301 length:1146 start_codon:yes stop_codon:yes gene_type:complete
MCRKNNPRLYLALEVVIGEDHFKGIHDQWISKEKNDPFDSLDDFLNKHSGKHILIFISYDVKNHIEDLQTNHKNVLKFPLIHCIVPVEKHRFKGFEFEKKMNEDHIQFEPKISKKKYIETIRKIKNHIQNGDFYEANFCYEWTSNVKNFNAKNIFGKLSNLTQAPYKVYADLMQHYVLSASPELFLKKRGNQLLSSPIKGTRKRMTDETSDNEIKKELHENTKERAENIMIVDLVRNDLSKIAKRNTVKVKELCQVYTFKNIHQMISTISCDLKNNVSFGDIIKATFPMGSMTGAPKLRVMKLMDKYEPSRRGLYSGSIGKIKPNGDFDLNVVIRTLIYNKAKQLLSFHVGGAITIQSSAEDEYEETLIKAASLFKACKND